jgi:membrane protease YdiL (CAAX protease family)
LSENSLFYKAPGSLRAPWRLVIFIIASLGALAICGVVLTPVFGSLFGALGAPRETADSWVMTTALLMATVFMVRVVDRRPMSEVWLDKHASRRGVLVAGFSVGSLSIAIPTGLMILAGWLANDGGDSGSWFLAMLQVSLLLIPAALLEELMTRGYILSVLREVWGWKWAVGVTSVAFGLMHLANPGVAPESILFVTLAGFFLAGVLYVTQSLYAAWIAHFAWNWTMAALFHVAVSGIPMQSPNYHYVDSGPDWATGGPWGPEGGLPAGLGMVAGLVFLYTNKQRREAQAEASREAHFQ